MALEEPDKNQIRLFESDDGVNIDRRARVSLFSPILARLVECVVSIGQNRVIEWTPLDDGRGPGILDIERRQFEASIISDRRWLEAARRRGIDPRAVTFECASAREYFDDKPDRPRIVFCAPFVKANDNDNYYAHPVDGLVAVVDVASGEVLDVLDDGIDPPVPEESGNFTMADLPPPRSDLKPLDIVQPDGPSFKLDGRQLRWQKWNMHIGFHPVEGLVLHRVGYEDEGNIRPILHRAGLSEMVVPYGDIAVSQFWRAVFDAGEVGLGTHANSLESGCDCLGDIEYLDAVIADESGKPRMIRNAICIHEEDFGVGWKHDGVHVATSETRRLRRLVVSFFATVGNYDYGFYWYFYTDGTIEVEVKLTGIIYTGAVHDGHQLAHGRRVAPNLYGPHHQHLFTFRLDVEVDGPENTVIEVDTVGIPQGKDNPWGNAFVAKETPLRRESEARRKHDTERSRYWKIESQSRKNRLGENTAYKLIPQYTPTLLADPKSIVGRLAGFARYHLWVTRYEPSERYAAGNYPAFGDSGLDRWSAADRDIENDDIVLWHTIGTTHIVRLEDWPVMPVERVGFTLKPLGFFDRNPSLDVPVATSTTSSHIHAGGGAGS